MIPVKLLYLLKLFGSKDSNVFDDTYFFTSAPIHFHGINTFYF